MNLGTRLTALASVSRDAVSGAATRLTRRLRGRTADHPERGDVPGWVMITLMTAILVAGLLAIAGPALETMFNDAMGRVGQ